MIWYNEKVEQCSDTIIWNVVPFVKLLFKRGNEAMTTIDEGAGQPARHKPRSTCCTSIRLVNFVTAPELLSVAELLRVERH
jgi:hypothetical protein